MMIKNSYINYIIILFIFVLAVINSVDSKKVNIRDYKIVGKPLNETGGAKVYQYYKNGEWYTVNFLKMAWLGLFIYIYPY